MARFLLCTISAVQDLKLVLITLVAGVRKHFFNYRLRIKRMNRKKFIKTVIGATLGISSAFAMTAQAEETIKVGILHSL